MLTAASTFLKYLIIPDTDCLRKQKYSFLQCQEQIVEDQEAFSLLCVFARLSLDIP